MSWFDGFGKKMVEESEDVKNARYNLKQAKEETKRLEAELAASKANERKLKLTLQSKCNHDSLVIPKNKDISNNFNDYFAKCTCCDAELFDHARAINYINNLNDQLSKLSKVTESMKVVGIDITEESPAIFKNVERLTSNLIMLRDEIMKYSSSEYNNSIKSRVNTKKTEEER